MSPGTLSVRAKYAQEVAVRISTRFSRVKSLVTLARRPLVKAIAARDDRVITADYLRSGGSTITGGGYYTSVGHEYLTVSFWRVLTLCLTGATGDDD